MRFAPSVTPVPGSGRDYCRSPLPGTGVRRGQSPCPTRESAERGSGKVIRQRLPFPLPLSALSLPVQPPRGLPILMFAACSSLTRHLLAVCYSLVLPLLAPYSLRALCPACPPPCAQGQPGFWPFCPCAQGVFPLGNPPAPPREAAERGAERSAASVCPFRTPLCGLSARAAPPGGFPF